MCGLILFLPNIRVIRSKLRDKRAQEFEFAFAFRSRVGGRVQSCSAETCLSGRTV